VNFATEHDRLLKIVDKQTELEDKESLPVPVQLGWVASIGKNTVISTQGLNRYLAFIGDLTLEALRVLVTNGKKRWNALAGVIYSSGFQALPIIALLSFMIGVVLTYQMGLQLKNYGASIYIVDLLGLSVLREFGPLLTAIMVAGRTGSAYTAQLGMMKINQELDALDTMGVTPAELLLLPKILGLVITLPLLTMWANIFGIFGGMVMASNMLDISWYDFLHRFPHVIPLKTLLLGLSKTPIFALIIGSVGCFQGVYVGNSATSVGENTTRSVVLSIFFIIVADAIFSVVFSKLQL
jgi:phospholipid/cholesterol/gamma-HCH transport system permease protein